MATKTFKFKSLERRTRLKIGSIVSIGGIEYTISRVAPTHVTDNYHTNFSGDTFLVYGIRTDYPDYGERSLYHDCNVEKHISTGELKIIKL